MHLLVLHFISVSQKPHHLPRKDCFLEMGWQVNDCHQLYSVSGLVFIITTSSPSRQSQMSCIKLSDKRHMRPGQLLRGRVWALKSCGFALNPALSEYFVHGLQHSCGILPAERRTARTGWLFGLYTLCFTLLIFCKHSLTCLQLDICFADCTGGTFNSCKKYKMQSTLI